MSDLVSQIFMAYNMQTKTVIHGRSLNINHYFLLFSLQCMEHGAIGSHGSHAQQHVARGHARDIAIAMHLDMVVGPAWEIIPKSKIVMKGNAQVRI